jgi:hypothetical protein
MRAEEIVMRIRSPQRKSFNTVPFLLTVFLLAAAPTSQLRATGSNTALFLPAVTYPSGGQFAASVAAGDLNGDSKVDVVVVNANSNTVGVLLGNGDGTFQPVVTYGSGGRVPFSVAVADVNGDKKPDLLVVNSCATTCASGSVGVLLGNGDGTFQSAVTYDSGGQRPSVAVGDVNGDDKLDLLVGNYRSIGVLLGNGDGTFQPAVTYGLGLTGFAYSLAVADFNGDGKLDLIVAVGCIDYPTCTSGAVDLLQGNGDGTFQAAVTYSSGGCEATSEARSVSVADLNGDGIPDVLVGNFSCGAASVLLGNGDGTFQTAVQSGP